MTFCNAAFPRLTPWLWAPWLYAHTARHRGELRDTLVFFFPALGARPEVARVAVQELLGDFNFLTCMGVSENVVE